MEETTEMEKLAKRVTSQDVGRFIDRIDTLRTTCTEMFKHQTSPKKYTKGNQSLGGRQLLVNEEKNKYAEKIPKNTEQ